MRTEHLHDPTMLAGSAPYWFRCAEPERPGDRDAVYVWACDGCFAGLISDVPHDPNGLSIEYADEGTSTRSTLQQTLDRVIEYRNAEGLPTFGVPPSRIGVET